MINSTGTDYGTLLYIHFWVKFLFCLCIDTVLAFKKKMKLAQFAEKDPDASKEAAAREMEEKKMAEAIAVGSRCEVVLPGSMPRRGIVMFTGIKHLIQRGKVWLLETFKKKKLLLLFFF